MKSGPHQTSGPFRSAATRQCFDVLFDVLSGCGAPGQAAAQLCPHCSTAANEAPILHEDGGGGGGGGH